MMPYPYYPYLQYGNTQIQNTQQVQSGFVTVHSEEEALRYPVALGNSMTFKIENQPIVIEKTMGTSQLDSPRVERFRLVKEDAPEEKPAVTYALAEDIVRIDAELKEIRSMLPKKPVKKKEDSEDE